MIRKASRCGVMIVRIGLPEPRPCLRLFCDGNHTPDLTGLENVFGYVKILGKGPSRSGTSNGTRWWVQDKFGDKRLIDAKSLFSGNSRGLAARKNSGLGFSKLSEYNAAFRHVKAIVDKKCRDYSLYFRMKLYKKWDPRSNGLSIGQSAQLVVQWMRETDQAKPGLSWQLHVLKTKKYPYGFFGPNGIMWRHKMDRHDQDLLDLISEFSNKKWKEFIEQENRRRDNV